MLQALLERLLAELQVGDAAQRADHSDRLAGAVHLRLASVVDPHRRAVGLGQPVVAFVGAAGAEMIGERGHARGLVARVDQGVVGVARQRRLRAEQLGRGPHPDDPVGDQIPVIGDVAGGPHGGFEPVGLAVDGGGADEFRQGSAPGLIAGAYSPRTSINNT